MGENLKLESKYEIQAINRLKRSLIADVKFQSKQGLYFIYFIITLIYLIILSQVPETYLGYVMPVIIFLDPSVVGLFFIGGILLLEKEQGILQVIVVTPLKVEEYILSKVMALTTIAVIAGLAISKFAYSGDVNYIYLIFGILLTSIFFTLFGIIIAIRSGSINEFFLRMVPWILVLVLPLLLLIVFKGFFVLNIFPVISCINLVYGAYHGLQMIEGLLGILYLIIVNAILFIYAIKKFKEYIVYGGQNV